MILTTEMSLSVIERFSSREIPVAFLDSGKVGPHISNIRIDCEKGVHEAVEHVLKLNNRQIAFISWQVRFKSTQLRRQDFLEAMKNARVSANTEPLFLEVNFKLDIVELGVR